MSDVVSQKDDMAWQDEGKGARGIRRCRFFRNHDFHVGKIFVIILQVEKLKKWRLGCSHQICYFLLLRVTCFTFLLYNLISFPLYLYWKYAVLDYVSEQSWLKLRQDALTMSRHSLSVHNAR